MRTVGKTPADVEAEGGTLRRASGLAARVVQGAGIDDERAPAQEAVASK